MTVPAVEAAASAIGDRAAAKKAAAKKAPAKKAPAKKAAPAPRGQAARPRARMAPDTATQGAPRTLPRGPRVPSARGGGRGPSAPSGRGFKLPGFSGNASTARKMVVAEFIVCVVLIGLTPILMRKPNKGKLYIPNDFVRVTAVSLLFLILALMSNNPKTARIASAFGALVTLGVAFNATQAFNAIGAIFTNAQSGTIKGADAGSDKVTMPEYSPVDLGGSPSGGGGGGKSPKGSTTPGGKPIVPPPTGPFSSTPPGDGGGLIEESNPAPTPPVESV